MHSSIAWLYGLQHFGVKLGLDNVRALLGALDRPDRAFRSVLVGGTNGKGSVAAMLEAMLRAHGLRTGLFTSPHLVRPNERIRLDGQDIDSDSLHGALDAVRRTIDGGLARGSLPAHPSFFETLTGTALRVFREHRVDCAVLEIGMGGRLDATNAVEADLSVVVTVDLDHAEVLGPGLERIAREKAAIAKPGRVLVTGAEQEEVLEAIRDSCETVGCRLVEARSTAELAERDDGAIEVASERRYPGLRLSLSGRHQRDNARVAIVALEAAGSAFGFEPDPDRVREALRGVRWAGRLQRVDSDPPLLLDGAHNPAGARALADYLRSCAPGRRVLLFGTMRKKDAPAMLEPLSGLVERAVVTRPSIDRAAEPEALADAARRSVGRTETIPDAAGALDRARRLARPDGLVVVCGSLYLVGEILGLLEDAPVPGPVPL